MPQSLTRILTVVALIALFTVTVLALAATFSSGEIGVHLAQTASGGKNTYRVLSIDPRVAAPLVPGDVFSSADTSFANRMRFARQHVGDSFPFVRKRGNLPFRLAILPVAHVPIYALVLPIVGLAMAACAAVIVARRWDAVEARALAYFFTGFGLTFSLGPLPWFSPEAVYASLVIGIAAQTIGLTHGVRFATLFPDPSARGIRRGVRLANRIVGTAYVVATTAFLAVSLATMWTPPKAFALFVNGSAIYYLAAISIAFTVANMRTAPEEKPRVRWVSLSLALGFLGPSAGIVYILATRQYAEWIAYANLTLVAVPLGTAYAIVRHRVLDLGFVLNRAIVFSLVSAFVLIVFAVLEWALGKVLVDASHTTSVSLEMALALALGFSLRIVHRRMERIVDDLFFRKRHESLARLRTFAKETAYITDLDVFLARTVEAIVREERAARCALYLTRGDGTLHAAATHGVNAAAIDENDPAVVRARATREPVALGTMHSVLDAETAYPLFVRETFVGLLACGARDDDETYAPDERAALAEVARAVAAAIDSLQIAAMRRELAALLGERDPSIARAIASGATGGAATAS